MENEKAKMAEAVLSKEFQEAKKERETWRQRWLNSQSETETSMTRDRYQQATGYVDGIAFASGVNRATLEEDEPPFCDRPPNGAYLFWACYKAEEAELIIAPINADADETVRINMMRPKPSYTAIELLEIGNHIGASNFFLRREGQPTTRRF